jgi:hypothetical protein
MIPYEELCEALARWREKNGMLNGPSARPPQGLVAPPPSPAPAADSTELIFAASVSSGFGAGAPPRPGEDDELPAEGPTTLTPSPFAAETPILAPEPTVYEDVIHAEADPADAEPPTSVHVAAPEERRPERDITNEISIDDFLDERSDRHEPN